MNINAAFPSKYIKSAEVPEEGLTLVIDRVEIEDVDGKGARKPVVYFRKAKKGMALNVTNSKKISSILGSAETDEWGGQAMARRWSASGCGPRRTASRQQWKRRSLRRWR
jgi:hypothetical protein